jgi:hypothetical protein
MRPIGSPKPLFHEFHNAEGPYYHQDLFAQLVIAD